MAPWGSWDPEPPSEANNVVTGRDFTIVDLPTDKINEREYGTASPTFTERPVHKGIWTMMNNAEGRPFTYHGPPREAPCLQCANRMMVRGFHGLCRDHLLNVKGKCYCCVLHGEECDEVPETAFKSIYELQAYARKMMYEGSKDTDWDYLSGRAELALLKGGILWSPRQETNNYWDGNNHVKEPVNGKFNQFPNGKTGWGDKGNTSWDGSDNIDVNSHVNHIKIAKTYWNDDSNTNWNVNENVNDDADTNVNQASNDNTDWGANNIPRWGSKDDTIRDGKDWVDDSDSDKGWGDKGWGDKGWDAKTASDPEIDNDCDDESDDSQGPIQLTPEFSSADEIISAIDRNTDVVADLCEIMEGLKGSLEVLHEDNVQSKKLLQKLLNEQRAVGDKQT